MRILNIFISCVIFSALIEIKETYAQQAAVPKVIQLVASKTVNNSPDTSFINVLVCLDEKNPRSVIYPNVRGIPDSLQNIRRYYYSFDETQAIFQAYKKGLINKLECINFLRKRVNDTINCTSKYVNTFFIIVSGISKRGNKYYLIDSNNNLDFIDEPLLKESELATHSHQYKVLFEKNLAGKIHQDSTWITFRGIKNRDLLNFKFCEKTFADYSHNAICFSIIAYPSDWTGVLYSTETTFQVTDNLQRKKQVFGFNQYVNLGGNYYSVSCSPDGRQLTLTLDKDAWIKGSVQQNMPAIKFKALSLKGDSILFPKSFKGKYVLLDFWATTCAPCIDDMKNYYKPLYQKFGKERFEIIGVADDEKDKAGGFVKTNMIPWTIIPDPNRHIQELYRVKVLPTLYLIDPNGIIIAEGSDLRKEKINNLLEKLIGSR